MADWVTISSLATAAGTMVLACATFVSVRSAHRSAAITERALLAQIRPVIVTTRSGDPTEKVGFIDGHWMRIEGQRVAMEVNDDGIYMAFSIRNVGAGVAVLDRWDMATLEPDLPMTHREPEDFQRLTRDIYIPAGDTGFWQGAWRDPSAPEFAVLEKSISERRRIAIDLLYEDHEGGQRTISRFGLTPVGDEVWLTTVVRHWNLDRDDPRED
jgi:hypothetical protein